MINNWALTCGDSVMQSGLTEFIHTAGLFLFFTDPVNITIIRYRIQHAIRIGNITETLIFISKQPFFTNNFIVPDNDAIYMQAA